MGNGRLGAMVYGDPVNEEIQLNEETVSAGSPYKNYNSEAKEALPAIRKLIFDGNYAEAQLMAGFFLKMALECLIKQSGVCVCIFKGRRTIRIIVVSWI